MGKRKVANKVSLKAKFSQNIFMPYIYMQQKFSTPLFPYARNFFPVVFLNFHGFPNRQTLYLRFRKKIVTLFKKYFFNKRKV